jgi:MOSC domain-containing protein YiiM
MGKTVFWKGRSVVTGIFKTPVQGPVAVRKLNLDGDRQSDLTVHGGYDKAVYSYAREDYVWWKEKLGRELEPGAFGENLTTEGLNDREVFIGDVLRAGTAMLQVVQPRLPCYKLGIKFGDDLMPKKFMQAARWGIYFRVLEEGIVEAGDSVEFVNRDRQRVSVSELASLASPAHLDVSLLNRALGISSLNQDWQEMLEERKEGANS